MEFSLRYKNPEQVAHALRDKMAMAGWDPISARPWDWARASESAWWVIPSKEWPAFRFGKLYFATDKIVPGKMFCCFHIEKGADPVILQVSKSARARRLVIEDNWTWYRFMQDMENGKVDEALGDISSSNQQSVRFGVSGHYISAPDEFEPYNRDLPWDEVTFSISEGAFASTNVKLQADLLGGLAAASSARDVAQMISQLEDPRFLWINIFCGIEIATGDDNGWDVLQLYNKVLKPWEPWLL